MNISITQQRHPALFSFADNALLFLARFSLAGIFWISGETKIDGFAFNFIDAQFNFSWPILKESTFYLFENEYQLPWIPFEWAAYLATTAEHLLPIFLLSGFLTRFAALGILGMTLVIQIFVYPDAYPTHLSWIALALLLMLKGAGTFSFDYWYFKKRNV